VRSGGSGSGGGGSGSGGGGGAGGAAQVNLGYGTNAWADSRRASSSVSQVTTLSGPSSALYRASMSARSNNFFRVFLPFSFLPSRAPRRARVPEFHRTVQLHHHPLPPAPLLPCRLAGRWVTSKLLCDLFEVRRCTRAGAR